MSAQNVFLVFFGRINWLHEWSRTSMNDIHNLVIMSFTGWMAYLSASTDLCFSFVKPQVRFEQITDKRYIKWHDSRSSQRNDFCWLLFVFNWNEQVAGRRIKHLSHAESRSHPEIFIISLYQISNEIFENLEDGNYETLLVGYSNRVQLVFLVRPTKCIRKLVKVIKFPNITTNCGW